MSGILVNPTSSLCINFFQNQGYLGGLRRSTLSSERFECIANKSSQKKALRRTYRMQGVKFRIAQQREQKNKRSILTSDTNLRVLH